jgi:DNA-binding NarL/FixJ family response regulator
MIRVIVVDDQELVRAGFKMILNAQEDIDVVAEASDGREALDIALRYTADVILMDIRMPEVDGLSATESIRALVDPPPAVLVLTTFDPDEYVYRALRAGAAGFVLKDIPPDELVTAIRVVAAGDALIAPSITRRLIERFADQMSAPVPKQLERLTEREVEVLLAVAAGGTNAEIADQLFLSPATVKTHVSNILAKLGFRDRIQAVVFAHEHGLMRGRS